MNEDTAIRNFLKPVGSTTLNIVIAPTLGRPGKVQRKFLSIFTFLVMLWLGWSGDRVARPALPNRSD